MTISTLLGLLMVTTSGHATELKDDDLQDLAFKEHFQRADHSDQQNTLAVEGQFLLMSREQFTHWLLTIECNRKITLIQHHHTWAPSYSDFTGNNHFSLLQGMMNFHINEMGWDNIAQNITTFPDGTIAISRPLHLPPEGSIGAKANSNGLSIEHIGNFDIGNDQMTVEQKETIVHITALLCIKFELTPSIDTITYHRWWDMRTGERVLDDGESFQVKTCPGTGFFGGNTTASAKTYFYPLVAEKIAEILATIK